MNSISLEQQQFILNKKTDNPQGLPLMRPTLVKNLVIQIIWDPKKIKSAFRIQVFYFHGSNGVFVINYNTLNFFVPIQKLFLSRQQAEQYNDTMCKYVEFSYSPAMLEADSNDPIEMSIAAYEFKNEKERETDLIHRESQHPHDGSFPDTGDLL